jgi:hypothetical protein
LTINKKFFFVDVAISQTRGYSMPMHTNTTPAADKKRPPRKKGVGRGVGGGRPPISAEGTVQVAALIPTSAAATLDALAAAVGISRAEYLRRLVERELSRFKADLFCVGGGGEENEGRDTR